LSEQIFDCQIIQKIACYGSDDGICYDDWMMKDINCSLMVIWSVISYKDFKIGIEGTVVETLFDGKLCSAWNRIAVCRYLSMLTGLKNNEFKFG
jgi:hypothetical protein